MKISVWFILLALAVGAAAMYVFFMNFYEPAETITIKNRPLNKVVFLKLPKSIEAEVFGPKYWEAYHKLTEMIPCSICRDKAVPFMRFFHDVVNKETGKEIFDKENYNRHIDMICKLPKA